jgi:hypothetical protein
MFRPARIISTAVFIVLTGCTASTMGGGATTAAMASPSSEQLHDAMRKLWSDHVFWTRLYIIEAAANNPAAQTTLNRLMRNQEDIGSAIAPYYGTAAGSKLTDLLKQHISIAGDLVAAAKAGDNAKVADANTRWHANADDIATFLSGANPNWPKATVLSMLNQHLALTTQEATQRLHGQYPDDEATFDAVYNEILGMSDALADGIVKQFPSRFVG